MPEPLCMDVDRRNRNPMDRESPASQQKDSDPNPTMPRCTKPSLENPMLTLTLIPRAIFNKTSTFHVVQAIEPISYTVSRSVQSTQAETKITNKTAGLEIGVENAVEAGGNVVVAEGKETIKINAKGAFNMSVGSQNLLQTLDGYIETVVFTGYKIKSSAPSIKPL